MSKILKLILNHFAQCRNGHIFVVCCYVFALSDHHSGTLCVLNVKALVGAFNQKKALVGAFSVIVQLHRLIGYRTSPHAAVSAVAAVAAVNVWTPPILITMTLWHQVSNQAVCTLSPVTQLSHSTSTVIIIVITDTALIMLPIATTINPHQDARMSRDMRGFTSHCMDVSTLGPLNGTTN